MEPAVRSAQTSVENSLPHVVIVGGGFGGLYAARGLGRAPVRVTVIDRHNYHLFRPMLYCTRWRQVSCLPTRSPRRSGPSSAGRRTPRC
jgi:NADH:ubiquinone reductase (H+-translocating)